MNWKLEEKHTMKDVKVDDELLETILWKKKLQGIMRILFHDRPLHGSLNNS